MTGSTAGAVTSITKPPRRPAKGAKKPRPRRKPRRLSTAPKRPPPVIEPVMHTLDSGGRLAVVVPLQGSRGSGRHMTVDLADWTRLTPINGTRWGLREVKKGYEYVVSMGSPAAGRYLARVVTGAPEGTVVGFRNGDRLDFSRSNLMVMGVSEAKTRAFTRKGTGKSAQRP